MAPPASAAMPRTRTPIVPKRSIAGRALVAVVAIMTFLASLTTGGRGAGACGGAATGSPTWRARSPSRCGPAQGRDLDGRRRARGRDRPRGPGIGAVRALSKEESARLLEPWLGEWPRARRFAGAAHDRGEAAAGRAPRFRAAEEGAGREGAGRHASTIIAPGSSGCAPWRRPRSSPASACSS